MVSRIDPGEVRAKVVERLDERSAAHSLAVGDTAAELAAVYGIDAEKAYLAGILHDWAREERADELLSSAAELGLEITDIDAKVPYLLHAHVGARQIQAAFPGVDAEIVEAVSTHTMGDIEMSRLARLVYVADLIEPARQFEGVGELRQAVGVVSLDELYARAYAASIAHVVRRRHHLHPHTVAVWNSIVDRGIT